MFIEITLLIIAISCLYWYKTDSRLPPGPKGIPLLGVIPFLKGHAAKRFEEWSEKYGKLYTVKLGQHTVVVMTDYEAINQVLVKQGYKTRGRAPMYIYEVCTKKNGIIWASTEVSDAQRHFTLSAMRRLGVGKKIMEVKVQEEATALVEAFRESSLKAFDPKALFLSAVVNVVSLVCMGERFSYEKPTTKELARRLVRSVDGDAFMVHLMSYCGYLSIFPPFSGAMKRYVEDFDYLRDLCMDKIKEHQETYVEGEIRDFIDIFIEEMKKEDHDKTFQEDQLALLLRDFVDAGSQAVSFTLEWCMIILAKYPEYQKKIRQEVDTTVGHGNPVLMSHRDQMSFTQAFIFEVMRTCTIVALGHVCTVEEGVEVNGYKLPKNTPILSVTSAVHNDPRYFEKPNEFRPERFLNPENGSFQKSKYWMPFSVGRRSCAGYQLAHVEIFIILVNLVRSFDIAAADEKNIPELNDGEHGVLYLPPPFEMRVTERVV